MIKNLYPSKCDGRCDTTKPHVGEEKLDGHRGLLHFGKNLDRGYLTSTNKSVKTGLPGECGLNVPQLTDDLRIFQLMDYTVLDGELVVPGYDFESVQTITGSLPENAIAWQEEHEYAVLRVFDMLFYNGKDLRDLGLLQRKDFMFGLLASAQFEFVEDIPSVVGTDHEEWFNKVVADGGEGLILKDPYGKYGKGWTKWKKVEHYDVVVMGFTEGTKKYRDMFGAVIFGAYVDGKLQQFGKCSGMEDGIVSWYGPDGVTPVKPNSEGCRLIPSQDIQPDGSRAWFHVMREELIGTVVEVKCNGLTKHGNLRHPQFHRVRPDKGAEQCLAPEVQRRSYANRIPDGSD